jgi:hypothetical protein
MILTHAELDSLVRGQHRHPHQLLGMHPLGDGSGMVVRAFLPNAAAVEIMPVLEKNRPRFQLERLHETGLYEGCTRKRRRSMRMTWSSRITRAMSAARATVIPFCHAGRDGSLPLRPGQ